MLRKARLDRGLLRKEVAEEIGTSVSNLSNWEANRGNVSYKFKNQVFSFLGICPYDASLSLGERLRERREYHGLSIKKLAKILATDPCTIAYWERGEHKPTKSSLAKIRTFLHLAEERRCGG